MSIQPVPAHAVPAHGMSACRCNARPRYVAWLLPFAMLTGVGCATTHAADPARPEVDGAAAAATVVLCRSTQAELEARLGTPTRDGRLHGDRIVSWITDWEPVVRYLAVQVDASGVVTDLIWNLPTEIPWTPTSQCPPR